MYIVCPCNSFTIYCSGYFHLRYIHVYPSSENFYFLHSHHGREGISFLWKMTFEIFMKSLRFEIPWVIKNDFYESVCLSVGRVRHNSRYNHQIELSLSTLYRSRKSKDNFVNQPHPIKIEGLSTSFVFLKKSKI